jgi:hypothetical protein
VQFEANLVDESLGGAAKKKKKKKKKPIKAEDEEGESQTTYQNEDTVVNDTQHNALLR